MLEWVRRAIREQEWVTNPALAVREWIAGGHTEEAARAALQELNRDASDPLHVSTVTEAFAPTYRNQAGYQVGYYNVGGLSLPPGIDANDAEVCLRLGPASSGNSAFWIKHCFRHPS